MAERHDPKGTPYWSTCVAFVVSDFLTTGYERALALASAKHDVIPVILVDRRDFELPDVFSVAGVGG